MQLFIKNLAGETITVLDVDPSVTVDAIKQQLSAIGQGSGCPATLRSLLLRDGAHGDKKDGDLLSDLGLGLFMPAPAFDSGKDGGKEDGGKDGGDEDGGDEVVVRSPSQLCYLEEGEERGDTNKKAGVKTITDKPNRNEPSRSNENSNSNSNNKHSNNKHSSNTDDMDAMDDGRALSDYGIREGAEDDAATIYLATDLTNLTTTNLRPTDMTTDNDNDKDNTTHDNTAVTDDDPKDDSKSDGGSGYTGGTGLDNGNSMADTIPISADIKVGRLDNGMTYYIHRNAKPKGRVSLRLCARVGSLHEEEGENGMAHFIEHLAFEGTATYGTGDIAKYLESIGTAFGADLNARTHLLETVYTFQVPVGCGGDGGDGGGDGGGDTSLLARGLDILSQWAGGIRISEEDVNVRRREKRRKELCCMLYAVCCVLCAVCCVLCAVCCVLCAVCCMLCAVCCVLCCVLYGTAC